MPPKFKKRKLNESKTEEVVFDPSARFDYLTGFHKRKVERAKHAQEAALRRAREEKILERKKLRQERKEEVERHIREVNAMLPKRLLADENDDNSNDSDQEDWNGIADPEPIPVDHEEEYIDEDKYTTVTVEEVDVSRNGLTKLKAPGEEEEETTSTVVKPEEKNEKPSTKSKTRRGTRADGKEKPSKVKRKKKRDFRYESKADRKMNHLKVRAKKSKLAQARRGE